MKKLIMILAFVATSVFAEPSFDQIQNLIGRQQYAAAEQGLEQIIKNHPNSAKAYYSMAQAQAGLGNQDKARYALNKATGLDPTLSFASESQVRSLQEALTPQVKKIEMIEESHFWRNLILVLFTLGIGYVVYRVYKNNKKADDDYKASFNPVTPVSPTPSPVKEESYVKATKSEVYKTKVEDRKVEATKTYAKPEPTPSYSYSAPAPQPVAHTTVVNNSSNDGLLTGVILGNMMSHHDHDRVIEREVIREVPVRSSESSSARSSSWDSDSSSNSWDSDSSSSSRSSSSWSSSSSSDSSWSSSSDSSSSWDSGSSSSDSSW